MKSLSHSLRPTTPRKRLGPQEVRRLVESVEAGARTRDVAERFGLSREWVCEVVRRERAKVRGIQT